MPRKRIALKACLEALVILVGGSLCCSGQTVLHRWDFGEGQGRWFAAHSCAPLEVKDGLLQVRVTGFDPYIYSSQGPDFRIEATPSTFVRMTARCNVSMPATFFWAEIQNGRDTGFRAGKEVAFRMHGDGQFHQYNVFPGWTGQISRLRLDPPGGAEEGAVVEIGSIEILQLPAAPASTQPTWSFAGTLAGFVPRQYVGGFRFEADGVVLRGFGPAATLVNEELDLTAEQCPWLSLEALSTEPTVLTVMWRNEEETYSKERARVRLVPGRAIHNIRLDRFDSWTGKITGLRLQWPADEEPVEMEFRRLSLGMSPAGPARLEIVSAGTDRYLVSAGEPVRFTARVRNAGGEVLEPQRLQLRDTGVADGVHVLETPQLEPATETEVSTVLTVTGPKLELSAPGEDPPRAVMVTVAPALDADMSTARGAVVTESCAKISTGTMRLRAPAHPGREHYGPLVVEVLRDGRQWQRVGVLPACGALATGADVHEELPWGKVAESTAPGSQASLIFTAVRQAADGTLWTSTADYRLVEETDRIVMTHTLRCDRDGSLYRYDGPALRVGDGTFGKAKYEALFPGLEYLAAHEVSSSDRDILPPGDLRAVTDPRRICIPTMAITSPDHDLVALLWDNEQRWSEDHDQPAAVFASPNLVESGDPRLGPSAFTVERSGNNHLLGLFAPSIPDFLDENGLRSREPVVLETGKSITLQSILLVRSEAEVLDAVTEWLKWSKPGPIGDPPKSLREHYALSLRGFEEILYTPGKGWASVKGWDPSPSPATAEAYLYLAEQLQRPELRQTAIERIGQHRDISLALHLGDVSGAVRNTRSAGFNALKRREPDGNWVFHPTEKTASLGEAGDTNVGMAAGHVRQILYCAAQSADPELLKEGLQGLEWIRQWRVPRGAQVWEIPLHAPDILASSHCCEAFLWGYRLTGDESYLEDAVYWARTGLPFVYFWQTPTKGLEPMRGGTIPIFGATFYVGSWYGRLVQWCGLEYAASLLNLAPYDDSHDWRTIARDITVSGWRQQQEKEGYQGLYPDSWSMLTGDISWGLMLGPLRLVRNQLALDGYHPEGDTRLFRRGDALVALLGPGRFEEVSAGVPGDGSRITDLPNGRFDLEFRHRFRNHSDCYVALVGATNPGEVKIDGVLAGRVTDLDTVEQGWMWSPSMPGVIMRLHSSAKAPVSVQVSGLNPRPAVVHQTRWTFDADPEGWTAENDLAAFEIRNGALVCVPTGGDPFLTVRLAGLDAKKLARVRIRYRTRQNGSMQLFWSPPTGYSAELSVHVPLQGNGEWRTAEVDLSAVPGWQGTIVGFRIDPPSGGMEIDEVEFLGGANIP